MKKGKINKVKVVACNNVIVMLFKKYINNASNDEVLDNYYHAIQVLSIYFREKCAENGLSFDEWFRKTLNQTEI